jgi:glycosyltransferase involved in cell wall biosynthesis
MTPLVSVIIPAFNAAGFIKETIDSVLVQTMNDFELIIVDDGSTDRTGEVVKAINDRRIIYHYQANSGLPAGPRNTGASLARGKYLAFLDHDDVWLPRKLAEQMKVLSRDPKIALISTNAYFLFGSERSAVPLITEIKQSGYLTERTFFQGNKIIQSTVLVSKAVFVSLGGFNEARELKAVEDYDLWLRIYAQAPCYFLADCLAYYRRTDNSTYGGELKSAQREMAYYQKYFVNYGFPSAVKRRQRAFLLARLALTQYRAGDQEWRINLWSSLLVDPGWAGLARLLRFVWQLSRNKLAAFAKGSQ